MPSAITLADVARHLHLSVATVSYALRNDRRTSASTRQRVHAAARKLGYRSNASVSALMSHIRRHRSPVEGLRLALVWVDFPRVQVKALPFCRAISEGVGRQADLRGYSVETFYLSDPDLTALRLQRVVKARGIAGVILAPAAGVGPHDLPWDWNRFAVATIGNARWRHHFCSVSVDQFGCMCTAINQAKSRGCSRVIALLDHTVNTRGGLAWEGAFLAYATDPVPASSRLWRGDLVEWTEAQRFIEDQRADCVIVGAPEFAPAHVWRAQAQSPWYITLDREIAPDQMDGVFNDHRAIAAHAVDLVVEKLHLNEFGVADHPKVLSFTGVWQDARPSRRSRGQLRRKSIVH